MSSLWKEEKVLNFLEEKLMLGPELPIVLVTSLFPLSEERKEAPGDTCTTAPSDPSQTQKTLAKRDELTQGHPASERTSARTHNSTIY